MAVLKVFLAQVANRVAPDCAFRCSRNCADATGPNRALSIWVSLVVLVAIASSAVGAAAAADVKPDDKVVEISRVSSYQLGSDVVVSVSLKAGRKLTDAKVAVSLPELSIRSSNRVDFSRNKKQAVHLEIPVPDEFDPFMRIVFSSDEGRRVKFRPVILQ